VGDKLTAHIHVRNSGGETLHIEHLGVRGRRDSSENWDIGFWTMDLAPGQEWQLDPNNERPLQAGSYSFRISYSLDGSTWQEIGSEISFTVASPTPTATATATPTATTVPVPAYSISGRVTDAVGSPIAGVTIAATGGHSGITASDGRYTLSGLPAGTYTLTPSRDGYFFSPSSRTVTVPPDGTGKDFTALACVAPSGLNVCTLLPGDILLKRGSTESQCRGAKERGWIEDIGGTYFTHSALYLDNLAIAEAAGYADDPRDQVWKVDIQGTQFWSGQCVTDWAVVRPQASDEQKRQAVAYAIGKAEEEGVVFDIKASRDDEKRFYCSKLVWRAYQAATVEVESQSAACLLDLGRFVTPDELYFGSPVVQELPPARAERLKAYICSPGHITLVDASGRRAGFDPATGQFVGEIPEAVWSGPDAMVETVTVRGLAEGLRVLVTGFDLGAYSLGVENVDHESAWSSELPGDTEPGKAEWFSLQPQPGDEESKVIVPLHTYLPLILRSR
ncbi:MAG: carboxypeptidase regulatory-like domain-containing protein, partial [Anaerolineae bacterium]